MFRFAFLVHNADNDYLIVNVGVRIYWHYGSSDNRVLEINSDILSYFFFGSRFSYAETISCNFFLFNNSI